MRICYIVGGAGIHTERWIKYFADKGHEVHVISSGPLGDNDIGDARLHVLKQFRPQIRIISSLINMPLNVIQVRRIIKGIKPDILHAHYITDCGFPAALSRFRPLVLTIMGSDILIDPKRNPLFNVLTRYTLKRADLITCSGQNLMKEAIRLGVEPSKINLVHRGVDTKKFKPQSKSSEEEHARSFDDFPVVISTRGLKAIYNVETLIESVPLVLKQIPDIKFIVVGDGTQKDYLKGLARSLGVLKSVRFVGQVPHKELPHYLAAADVYISTSLSDGASVSLAEAMACGLAPVVTDVGDNQKWITNGENGFIIPVKRPDLLAEKIIYLINNRELREKMAKANRQLVEEKANYEKEMEKMTKLYKEVIAKRNTASKTIR